MKLELKHLAPYLPYGLKYATLSDNDDNYYVHPKHNTISVGGNQSNVTNICLVEYSKPIYKIILRPLSDLTKEEHLNYGCNGFDTEIQNIINKPSNVTNEFQINRARFDVVQFLIENHFDIYDLIPKRLAIDINTIK